MPDMGGFWPKVPKMTAVAIFFSVAALGMRAGNFIGEFLALIGAFQANVTMTVVAAFGLILASVYSLWVLQKVFQGEYNNGGFDDSHLTDLSRREMLYFAAMMIGLVWMGLYPQTFLFMSELRAGTAVVRIRADAGDLSRRWIMTITIADLFLILPVLVLTGTAVLAMLLSLLFVTIG